MSEDRNIWAKRMKEARLKAGISQKQLGIRAGLDQFVASTRINRYEQGVHHPDYSISQRIAKELDIPTAFLYSDNDDIAHLLALFGKLSEEDQQQIIELAQSLSTK